MAMPSWLIEFERKLYEENELNHFLAQIETRAGVPRLYVVLGKRSNDQGSESSHRF